MNPWSFSFFLFHFSRFHCQVRTSKLSPFDAVLILVTDFCRLPFKPMNCNGISEVCDLFALHDCVVIPMGILEHRTSHDHFVIEPLRFFPALVDWTPLLSLLGLQQIDEWLHNKIWTSIWRNGSLSSLCGQADTHWSISASVVLGLPGLVLLPQCCELL